MNKCFIILNPVCQDELLLNPETGLCFWDTSPVKMFVPGIEGDKSECIRYLNDSFQDIIRKVKSAGYQVIS